MRYDYVLEDISKIIKEIFPLIENKIIVFEGKMGAGKTTFIKAFCQYLKVNDTVHSPTFSLVNEYLAENEKIYHFDFYRIKDISEAYDIGVCEYFDSGAICLVEWAEKISDLLPKNCTKIQILAENYHSKNRTLIFTP